MMMRNGKWRSLMVVMVIMVIRMVILLLLLLLLLLNVSDAAFLKRRQVEHSLEGHLEIAVTEWV